MSALVSILAVVFGVARAWPQVVRIVVRKQDAGVSLLTWYLMMCSFITWTALGIVNEITAVVFNNVLNTAGAASVLIAVARHRRESLFYFMLVAAGAIAVNVANYKLFGTFGTEALGIAIGISMFLPQAWAAATKPIDGVSPFTWLLAFITTSLWAFYGVLIHEWSLVWPTVVLAPTSAFIFLKVVVAHRKSKVSSHASLGSPVASNSAKITSTMETT